MTIGNESIFAKRHGSDHFKGPLIPFGALVKAMPSAIHDGRRLKFDHTLQPAVFLGYIVQPGCRWYKEFCYMFLDDVAGMSFLSQGKMVESARDGPFGQGRRLRERKGNCLPMPSGLCGR